MYPQAQHVSNNQHQLAFNLDSFHASHSPLRAAYERLQLSRQLTLEQAMSIPIFAIGIWNLAEAMTRTARSRQVRFERKE
jgi:hypothetical protein